jgi:hypothetical protein
MLDAELVGRGAMVSGKTSNGVGVALLGSRRHVAEGHVVEHALPERRDMLGHMLHFRVKFT